MIGKLRGIVDEIDDDTVILDVGGVGYSLFCSARTIAALPPPGEMAQLSVETHVREDHIHLYGFPDPIEREWFRLLATVQRVGNRLALVLLGAYSPQQLAQAILARDIAAFSRISGVGPKLAERIVTELKDKVTKLPTSIFQPAGQTSSKAVPAKANGLLDDAVSALVNLGYSRTESYGAVMKASQDAGDKAGLDQLIRQSLKVLAQTTTGR